MCVLCVGCSLGGRQGGGVPVAGVCHGPYVSRPIVLMCVSVCVEGGGGEMCLYWGVCSSVCVGLV